ncbi:hypothetical protein QCN29_03890 [Streptomyces sp. HNM0663]|uniref:Uncharacterized protein n=1 Tax=Streptomyces chengmaiensis TaxID=3040919 RepID=A0ABT6HGQ6_9ACTN|nr:hypothetical protein [Streptomyces chengmaiensis]MDH2387942.1 hypothetical protein [Streptomyces chengmaiensis]
MVGRTAPRTGIGRLRPARGAGSSPPRSMLPLIREYGLEVA